MIRIIAVLALLPMIASLSASAARGEPFTEHLDATIAALQSRSLGALTHTQRLAVDKALRLVAKPHDRLSQDLRTGAKVCSLVAHYLPHERDLLDLIDTALVTMEGLVVANADALVLALADSTLPAHKQAKRSSRVAGLLQRADAIPDSALKAWRFGKIQALIERLLDRYGP